MDILVMLKRMCMKQTDCQKCPLFSSQGSHRYNTQCKIGSYPDMWDYDWLWKHRHDKMTFKTPTLIYRRKK